MSLGIVLEECPGGGKCWGCPWSMSGYRPGMAQEKSGYPTVYMYIVDEYRNNTEPPGLWQLSNFSLFHWYMLFSSVDQWSIWEHVTVFHRVAASLLIVWQLSCRKQIIIYYFESAKSLENARTHTRPSNRLTIRWTFYECSLTINLRI